MQTWDCKTWDCGSYSSFIHYLVGSIRIMILCLMIKLFTHAETFIAELTTSRVSEQQLWLPRWISLMATLQKLLMLNAADLHLLLQTAVMREVMNPLNPPVHSKHTYATAHCQLRCHFSQQTGAPNAILSPVLSHSSSCNHRPGVRRVFSWRVQQLANSDAH